MNMRCVFLAALALLLVIWCAAPRNTARAEEAEGAEPVWRFGFAKRQILPEQDRALYIAGYHNGVTITGVLDYCEARALWLDAGGDGVLLIGVDCVALDRGTVDAIRAALGDIPGCRSVNVYATHTHAGPDTLGLWGPVATNGKDGAYMEALVNAAVEAAREAAANRQTGTARFGQTETKSMCRDSRIPLVYDENLYQLRLIPGGKGPGVRLLFYGAHAESLRGSNTLLSRDYPGMLCDRVTEETGDDAMFFPGAVGGLIMTREFVVNVATDAVKNLTVTAEKLTEYALSISEETERTLEPRLALNRQSFVVPLDNPVFLTYKLLGILNHSAVFAESKTGFGVSTELSVLMLDDLALALIPGEIFPELVLGGSYGDANPSGENPRPLREIAEERGVSELLIVGLANDELGYIIPPSDFLLNEESPYLKRTMDKKGEDHYEETNSVGPACAPAIARAFEASLDAVLAQVENAAD